MASLKKDNTPQQDAFLAALVETKGDIREALKLAGYHPNTPTRSVLEPLRDQIIDLAKNIMAANAMKAAFGMVDAIDRPDAVGTSNKIKAASELMDRVGLGKEEKKVEQAQPAAIIFLPPKTAS